MNDIERMKNAMKKNNSEKNSYQLLFSDRENRKAFIIMILAYTTYAFSGKIAIQTYTQSIFEKSGSTLDAKYAAMIIAGVQIFSRLPSTKLIEFWGRKPIYLFSGVTSATFFFLKDYVKTDVSTVSWLPLVGLILYQFMCNACISTITNVFVGELFSCKVKGPAVMITSIVMTLLMFATKMMIPTLNNSYGIYTTFWIFSFVCLIGPIIVSSITPETKGKNLEEVSEML